MWVVEVEEKGGTRERRNAPGVGIKVLYFLPEILKGKRRKQKKSWDFYFSVNSFFTFLFLLLYFQFIRLSFLFKWGCYTILEIKKDSQTKGILRRDRWYRLNQASKKKIEKYKHDISCSAKDKHSGKFPSNNEVSINLFFFYPFLWLWQT